MKARLILLALLLVTLFGVFTSSSALAQSSTYVRGYYRSNGTYVQPHYRSTPDRTTLNNYSTQGNINPYTGRVGTRSATPSYTTPSYPTYPTTRRRRN